MMNWWVDRGVDGFRMDVINLISKRPSSSTATPPPGRTRAHSFVFTANGPRLDEFLAEMNAAVGLDERNLLTVGEMPGSTIEIARRSNRPGEPRAEHGVHLRACRPRLAARWRRQV